MKAADYSGWYLLSDMDGTLIDSQGSTSEGNRRAIKTFTEGGGLFGIATGRAPNNLGDYLEGLPINAPCVFYNGGAVYDLKNSDKDSDTYIWGTNEALCAGIVYSYLRTDDISEMIQTGLVNAVMSSKSAYKVRPNLSQSVLRKDVKEIGKLESREI